MSARLHERQSFRNIQTALLEEAPSLAEAVSRTCGPIIVVGLFARECMDGLDDVKRLVKELGRDDIVLVGPVGTFEGVDRIIGAAVARHALAKTQA